MMDGVTNSSCENSHDSCTISLHEDEIKSYMARVIDYPKIKSPFVRQTINGNYVVTPEIEEGFEWVFYDDGVKAVDKLHGTNLCIIIKDGILQSVDNRSTRVIFQPCVCYNMKPERARMMQGIMNAIDRGYLKGKDNNRIYGEMIGPNMNGNIHEVNQNIFVPFDYLQESCHWKSWISNSYPKDFDSISTWFKYMPSLYSKRVSKSKITPVAEGLVFVHPDGRRAKLRRNMFDWYHDPRHNWQKPPP